MVSFSLSCGEFDRHWCCSRSLFDVISTDSCITVLFLSSLPTLFDYDSCLRDVIWCRDQDMAENLAKLQASRAACRAHIKNAKEGADNNGQGNAG